MAGKQEAKGGFNPDAFNEIERDPTTLEALEGAVRQVMGHPAKPQDGSENREPTRRELMQRWKLRRR